MLARRVTLVAVATAALGGAAHAAVLDFNGFAPGEVVEGRTLDLGGGVEVTVTGSAPQDNPVIVFDTDCSGASCTGGDPDLSSPFPPASGSDDQTDRSFGNALILSEDPIGDASGDPLTFPDPDDNAGGGMITLSFNTPVVLQGFAGLDIEERRGMGFSVAVDGTDVPGLQNLSVDQDGQYLSVDLLARNLFVLGSDYKFTFTSSGALDDVVFSVPSNIEEIPLPAGLPLLLTGLGLFGWLGARRKG